MKGLKLRKIPILFLTSTIILFSSACGNIAESNVSENALLDGNVLSDENMIKDNKLSDQMLAYSIDFEDENCGFAAEMSYKMGGDASDLAVEDVNGNKVLKIINKNEKAEVYIGFDAQALLGNKITDVKTIQFDIGIDGEFNAVSGALYSYTGEDNIETKLDDWSVYLEADNPKTLQLNLENSFVENCNNYFVISKESDSSISAPTDIYIDNISFLDENGNLIEADSSVLYSQDSPLATKETDEDEKNGFKILMEGKYAGDWQRTAVIPPSYFEGAEGAVNVTLYYEFEKDYDYYLIAPCYLESEEIKIGNGTEFADLPINDSGILYHHQKDGFIVIDDLSNRELSFTLTKEQALEAATKGGLTFQTYGLCCKYAIISDSDFKTSMEINYVGDNRQTAVIPASYFEGAKGAVNVRINYALEEGYDNYSLTPYYPDAADCMIGNEMEFADLPISDSGVLYHHQVDGTIVIDDWSNSQLTFSLTREQALEAAANGGLTFQSYGVTCKDVIVSHDTYKTEMEMNYAGDWESTAVISASYFEGAEGPVNITIDCKLEDGFDYYLIAPYYPDTEESKIGNEVDFADMPIAKTGRLYHHQSDGFIEIDDKTVTKLSFSLTKKQALEAAAKGGLTFQTYGVTCKNAIVSHESYRIGMETDYRGDWENSELIPASYFENVTGPINITVEYDLMADYDCYLIAPCYGNLEDTKIGNETEFADLTISDSGIYYHHQKDGFIVIDDTSNKSLSFTLTKEQALEAFANGGIKFQIYGITCKTAIVTK